MPVILRPEIAALQPYRQGKPAPDEAFKLSSNENPYPPHPAVLAAIAEASVNRYPEGTALRLRERLAARHGVDVDQIHVGHGSVSILYQLAQAVAAAGDEIVYAWRSFEAYPGMAAVSGATSITVPLLPDGRHDLAAMAAAVTERTRMVLVCTPNNPTSETANAAEFADFLDRIPDTVLVVLDHAYQEFVTDPDAVDGLGLLAEHPNLVVLRTFSKAYGLAGLRVGYAVGSVDVLDGARATAVPLAVTEQAQRAALAALDVEDELLAVVSRIIRTRERLVAGLAEAGVVVPRAQGNFVWLPTGSETAAAVELLERHDIVARALPPDGIRVTVGEEESVDRLLEAAVELVPLLQRAAL